ncbi:protein RNA-directed DNA methylation 3 [Telopea speciosissima]|uniref:protein RNA-directed DNA methylation 3 n=1 Tax=Telopea speciosissima TaxID=54955 RepID=UPI001CC5FCDA|nr:protein RNA-directed DNA methylation 3 [Telopea speciosissima]
MAVKGKKVKGKQVAGKGSSGKRKRDDTDKTGKRKRNNPGVLQFFDVAADVEDEEDQSEDDWFSDDDFLDKTDAELKDKNEAGKSHHLPFIPKEEELSDDELAELLKERYRPGSRHVVYAEDDYEDKSSLAGNGLMPSDDDPTIYKVKCMVGRERYSVFCLMQKYVELQSLGTKLQAISAFSLEHAKGYMFIEAYKEFDVVEACKGLCSIYSSRLSSVPRNEVSHLFITRSKTSEVSVGSWARMKYGIYKGDLTQVVAVNAARKRATVKLIPRIDLQAIAKKLSGEGTVKRTSVPAPRLISSSELEDFRKHIQYRQDRESGFYFEIIDGLMLKDGYLYKRVSIESLCCWDVVPSADELQRFEASKEHQSDDTEWLLGLYGEGRGKFPEMSDNEKTNVSKGTSGTMHGSGFELHDLVFFGEKDVGVIIGMEESDRFQILKDSEGEVETVTVELDELRSGSDDGKFTPLDHHRETISINDAVSVLEGPFKDRQGVIKQMYRGTLFIFDENQLESGGYFCIKSHFCEKLKHLKDASQENVDDGPGPPGFQDSMASPKSPSSSPKSSPPRKPWEARGNFRDSNNNGQGDSDGIFSIGQTVRIRVGPLKGYLCRVIAIYRSNVTVKLHCQLKVLSVKCEHLSEVRVKTSGESFSRDPASKSEIGNQDWSRDLMDGKGAFGESNGWNSSGLSTGRNSWPDFSASGFSTESPSANPFQSTASDPKKDEGDDAWGSKLGPTAGNKTTDSWETAIGSREDQNSAWDKVATKNKAQDAVNDKVGNWGGSADCWDKSTAKDGFGSSKSDGWEKAKFPNEGKAGCSRDAGDSWDKDQGWSASQSEKWGGMKENRDGEPMDQKKSDDLWHKGEVGRVNHASGWNSDAIRQDQPNSWDKGKQIVGNDGSALDSEGKSKTDNANQEESGGRATDSWKGEGGTAGSRTDWNSATAAGGWGSVAGSSLAKGDQGSSWNKDKGWSASQSEKWGGMKENREGEPMDRKKSDDLWHKGEVGNVNHGSGWNSDATRCDRPNSWGKGKQTDVNDGWALDSQGKSNTDNADQENSWGKAADTWKGKGGTTGSKTDWNSATAPGGWGNAPDSFIAKGDQGSSWNKDKGWSASQSGERNMKENHDKVNLEDSWGKASDSWKAKDGSSGSKSDCWNSATAAGGWNASQTENKGGTNGGWNRPRAAGADETLAWREGDATENETDGRKEDQNGCWGKPKSFDGGRGSGGRRGRGGNRGGGRGNFGRGRSYGGSEGGSQPRWSNGSNGSEGGGGGGWNSSNVSSEDQHTGGKSGKSDMGGNQASGWDRSSSWNIPKVSNENQSSGWQRGESDAGGNQSTWDKSSWSTPKGSAENPAVWNQGFGANEADGHTDQGRSSGPTRGGFEHRGRGRSNHSSGWGRGRGSGEEGSFRRNNDTNDSEHGWSGSGRADSWNQRGGFGNRGRGRRDQSGGGRGRGRGSGREGSCNWNQNNGDGQGDRVSSWNQGSDAGKGQWQGWSVGHSGQSRDGGGSSEAGGASSLGKRQDENPWGNTTGSWGASSVGNRKDENPGGDTTGTFGTSSSSKGKDENAWGNAAGSWGASSSDKGKENQWSNAAGSWGKGSGSDGGAKSGW